MATILERSSDFYVESLYISAGNQVFNVPRYYFEQNCDVLSLISPRPREEHGGAGWSWERPIILHDISAEEFSEFLNTSLDTLFSYRQRSLSWGLGWGGSTPSNKWEFVLKVASLLGFQDLKRQAIQALSQTFIYDTMKRVQLARSYSVEEWLLEGYATLVRRKAPLDDREIEALGLHVAIILLRMRDKGYQPKGSIEGTLEPKVKEELITSSMVDSYRESLFAAVQQSKNETIRSGTFIKAPTTSGPQYVVVRVQNVLFRVPKRILTESRCTSSNWFSSQLEGKMKEEVCIECDDVSPTEFRVLLHASWPSHLHLNASAASIEQDSHHWMTVLKLSTKWGLDNLRAVSISKLSPMLEKHTGGTEVGKVVLARQFGVQRWLLEAYQSIINREPIITKLEREVLGMDVVVELMELRDVYKRVEESIMREPSTGTLHRTFKIREVSREEVERKFLDEWKDTGESKKKYGSAALAARLSKLRGGKK